MGLSQYDHETVYTTLNTTVDSTQQQQAEPVPAENGTNKLMPKKNIHN